MNIDKDSFKTDKPSVTLLCLPLETCNLIELTDKLLHKPSVTLLCLPMETGNLTELNDKSLHLYLKWFSMWSFWNFSYADQDRCTWHNPDIGISETVFWEWVDTIRPLTVDPQLMSSSVQCNLLHKQNPNVHQSA